MLNELRELSDILREMKIAVKEWHREYKPLPKSTFRVWLAGDGSVWDIEELSPDLVRHLRRFGNNQNAFPAFNIASLYRVTDASHLYEWEQVNLFPALLDVEQVRSWCVHDNWRDSRVQQIDRCLHRTSLDLLNILEEYGREETRSVIELIRLAHGFDRDGRSGLRAALEDCIFAKLEKRENIFAMLSMLLYKGNPAKPGEQDSGSCSIILDLADWQKYGYPAASSQTTDGINQALLRKEASKCIDLADNTVNEFSREGLGLLAGRYDAFGMSYNPIGEPMPNVKLHGFDVTLRTMFHAQECQYRYGTIDDASYPIAKQNRSRAKGALEWMAQVEWENVLWKRVDEREIVFVYPDKLMASGQSVLPLRFAEFFGPVYRNPVQGNKQGTREERRQNPGQERAPSSFEGVVEEFVQTLEYLPAEERPGTIQIFSLRKMDRARSKVLFSRKCSLKGFLRNVRSWKRGCENIPSLWLTKRITPFPLQVARVVNNVWKQGGEMTAQGKTLVKRMQYYQGLELLLDEVGQETLRYYLSILIANSNNLVSYVGNQHNKGSLCLPIQQKETSLVLSVLGLLLDKSGLRKKEYMENVAFLMGQILKVSDELHRLYCQAERGGDMPLRLAGNYLFTTALAVPEQALAQLGQRMAPYIAWARQIDGKREENGKAAWSYCLYEMVMTKLKGVFMQTTRFDDFDKAQVFIGYLAIFPSRDDEEIQGRKRGSFSGKEERW